LAKKETTTAADNRAVPTGSAARSGAQTKRKKNKEHYALPRPNAISFSAVLTACNRGGQHGLAGQIVSRMENHGVAPTVAVVNVAMAAASDAGNWQHALQLMDGLRPGGSTRFRFPHLSPDLMSYGIAINACATGARWRDALGLLSECRATMPLAVNTHVFNAALQACAQAGKWKEAVLVLQEMHVVCAGTSPRHPLVRPDIQSFNRTIHACAVGSEADGAISILQALVDGSVVALMGPTAHAPSSGDNSGGDTAAPRTLPFPDRYSYVSALFACSNAGRYRQAQDLLATMPRGLRSASAFNIVMTQAGKLRDWQGALGLLAQMRAEGVRPDDYSIIACLQACVFSDTDDATQAGVAVFEEFGSTLGGGGSTLGASVDSKIPEASLAAADPSSKPRPSAALCAATVLFRRAGQFERALELNMELGKSDPRAHMAMEMKRRSHRK
jgi:pentatricopeptide repeat protein